MSVESAGDNVEEFEEFDDEEGQGTDSSHQTDETSTIVKDPSEILKSLSAPVRRKIKALKKLQKSATYIEAKFFEDVHNLECKYHQKYTPLYNKRTQIVTGTYEPNDEECDFPEDEDIEPPASEINKPEKETSEIGIPDFWLTILRNAPMTSELIHYYDEPILQHLKDVRSVILEKDPMGFVLEFHFSPNEYFSNQVLTKTYEMKCVPDESDPFSFEGPEIYKCKGCTINWFKGKDVTTKTVKKKQKHKSLGTVRTVVKTEKTDSFFNFFSPPAEEEGDDDDEDTQSALANHFELGHYLSERVIPRAVLYFTGEAQEDAYMEEETESESTSAESSDEQGQDVI